MDNELTQAFYGIFTSSKEIIKNNQRHLFLNMLDLLGRTCRTTVITEGSIDTDSLVEFWLSDVLPLVFDQDARIQTSAVNTMEQGLLLLEPSHIHKSKRWPELRQTFVKEFPDKIHKLREAKNEHWSKIWSLIIKILDREILKGANVINAFLLVLELGFRSSDSSVRAEAFFCWRLLIKIFAKYEQLLIPKRFKLICIPLKSSQSKSSHSANVKIRVWWYFITCIGKKLGEYFENAVEPFLHFVFGSPSRDIPGAVQQYSSVQTMSILCLVQLIAEEREESLDRTITEQSLEIFECPSPLITTNILKKHWQPIINAAFVAIRLLCNNNVDEENELKQHLLNMLLTRVIKTMLQLNLAACTKNVCEELLKCLPETLPLKTTLNFIASNGFVLETSTVDNGLENYSIAINSYLSILIAAKPFIPPAILHRCIEHFSKTAQAFEGEQNQWRAICNIIKVICCTTDKDDFAVFETRLHCWRNLSQLILGFLRENNLSYRRKDFAEVVNDFIIWPLRHLSSFAGHCQISCFDDDFCAAWRQLLLSGQNAPEREQFLNDIRKLLIEFITNFRKELPLAELIDAYTAAMMKLNANKDSTHIKEIFTLIEDVIVLPQIAGTKSFEQYLNTLKNLLLHLKNTEITSYIDIIKSTIAQVVNVTMKDKPAGSKFFDEWKQGILERFRSHPQKNFTTQIKEVFKKSEVFVIIPSVWMLNPDKLTERQKERFAERSVIPALYNDMSQSQDSSIKPWTPKKVVIAKQNETEIVISSCEPSDEQQKNEENLKSKNRIDNDLEIEKRNLRKSNAKKEETKIANSTEMPLRTRKSLRSQKLDEQEQKEEQTTTPNIDKRSAAKTKQNCKETSIKRDAKKSEEQGSNEDISSKCESTEQLSNSKHSCNQETHPNTELVSVTQSMNSPTEEIIQETPTECATEPLEAIVIESDTEKQTEPDTEMGLHTTAAETNPIIKEGSPKKTSTRLATLSSPPDRRTTNNTCSPSLRPKPSPHLTGRGAQLINMIKMKNMSKMKIDSSTSTSSALAASRSSILLARAESTPVRENMFESMGNEHTSTPLPGAELLTFTKRLPSPSASPSASILKRKLRRESLDESPYDSPVSKRKKVSFHDPPVSVTKEYLKDIDENNIKPKRCLALDKVSSEKTLENRHALKRRSKLDSINEIESYTNEQTQRNEISESMNAPSTRSTNKSNSEILSEQLSTEKPIEVVVHSSESLPNAETALKIVLQEYSLETVLESYFSVEKPTSSKAAADTLAKFMSKCMTSNAKMKSTILEVLSENHSKDFLDHAIQENLSSVVCDRLNLNSIIEYISAKSKLNSNCLRSLLSEIPEVLKQCKLEGEPLHFIKSLMESLNPNDATILDLISILMRFRNERQSISPPELESTDVSSSNL